jgi:hypothetical protein
VIAPRSHRERAVPPDRMPEVSRTAGWISPVLVVDGAVAGVWEHELHDGDLSITVRPFGELPAAVPEGVQVHAARYATLLGATGVDVGWG